jgi:hypothetical protein
MKKIIFLIFIFFSSSLFSDCVDYPSGDSASGSKGVAPDESCSILIGTYTNSAYVTHIRASYYHGQYQNKQCDWSGYYPDYSNPQPKTCGDGLFLNSDDCSCVTSCPSDTIFNPILQLVILLVMLLILMLIVMAMVFQMLKSLMQISMVMVFQIKMMLMLMVMVFLMIMTIIGVKVQITVKVRMRTVFQMNLLLVILF